MLHPLAQDAYIRLTRNMEPATAIDWWVAFFDRVAEVDAIARRESRRACSQDDLERLDLPFDCGHETYLYRPSVGGMNWLRTKASEWWGKDARKYTLALAYVCAHREKNAIAQARTRLGAWARITVWAIKTRVSEEALRRAAIALLPPPDDSISWFAMEGEGNGGGGEADLMAIAATLAKEYGQSPEYWLWEASDDDFWGAFVSIIDRMEAEGDPKHEAPSCWWRRHRRALMKCEQALRADTEAWLAKRNGGKTEAKNG